MVLRALEVPVLALDFMAASAAMVLAFNPSMVLAPPSALPPSGVLALFMVLALALASAPASAPAPALVPALVLAPALVPALVSAPALVPALVTAPVPALVLVLAPVPVLALALARALVPALVPALALAWVAASVFTAPRFLLVSLAHWVVSLEANRAAALEVLDLSKQSHEVEGLRQEAPVLHLVPLGHKQAM